MHQIRPGETFRIVRQLDDPQDTNTYYIRAVIKNSSSGSTLKTVDLTDAGSNSQRFTGSWIADQDPSGQGLYVDITTTVYTDSGCTTKSEKYAIENMQAVVDLRYGVATRVFGGNVSNGMTKESMRKLLEEFEGKKKGVDLTPVLNLLQSILGEVREGAKGRDVQSLRKDLTQSFVSVRAAFDEMRASLTGIAKTNKDLLPLVDAVESIVTAREITGIMEAHKKEMRGMNDETARKMRLEAKAELERAVATIQKFASALENLKVNTSIDMSPIFKETTNGRAIRVATRLL